MHLIMMCIKRCKRKKHFLTLYPEVVRPAFLFARTHFMRRKKVRSISIVWVSWWRGKWCGWWWWCKWLCRCCCCGGNEWWFGVVGGWLLKVLTLIWAFGMGGILLVGGILTSGGVAESKVTGDMFSIDGACTDPLLRGVWCPNMFCWSDNTATISSWSKLWMYS